MTCSPALRLLRELRGRGVDLPVIAAFAPFGDPKAITRLIHEVPGAALPSAGGRRAAGATRSRPTRCPPCCDGVARLRDLIRGVLIHAPSRPDDRMTGLIAGAGQHAAGVMSAAGRVRAGTGLAPGRGCPGQCGLACSGCRRRIPYTGA